ncbi:MAG: hypothetical protein ACRDTH_16575 [Pseudonocardiaceae bacterium]
MDAYRTPGDDTGGVEDPVRLRVAFPCQHENCQRAAAIVEVTRRGQLFIDEEQDIIYRIFPQAQGTIRVTGFLPYTSFSTQITDLAATAGAVRALDAAALHAADRTWVPFYCHQCDRSFCGEHWSLKPTFDWGFDYYSGTCPVGHPHFIDHC